MDKLLIDEKIRFGDLVQLGLSHGVVYLAGGYVLMKDDNGSDLAFRITHFNDLKKTQSEKGVIQYIDRFPTSLFRLVR